MRWLLVVLAAVLGSLSPALDAHFWVMDDHEIIEILGPDGRIARQELWSKAYDYAWVRDLRLRPLYYVLRVGEAFLFGPDARAWHASRLLLAALCATLLYGAVRGVLSAGEAALATLLFFSGRQNEIWTRLGPAETYGAVIVAFGLWSIRRHLEGRRSSTVSLVSGLLVLHLAGYVKESFIPLAPAALVMIVLLKVRSSRSAAADAGLGWKAVAACGLMLASLVAVQVGLVIRGLQVHGHVYARAISALDIPRTAFQSLYRYAAYSGWPLPVACAFTALVIADDRHTRERLSDAVLFIAMLLLLLGPQWLIYASEGMDGRYLIPGALFVVFAFVWSLAVLRRCQSSKPGLAKRLRWVSLAASAGLVGFWQVRLMRAAADDVQATRRFQTSLVEIMAASRANPAQALILSPRDARDYEAVFALRTYLAPVARQRRLFLKPPPARQNGTPLDASLTATLTALSTRGGQGFAAAAPFDMLKGDCLEVLFQDQPDRGLCRVSRRVALY